MPEAQSTHVQTPDCAIILISSSKDQAGSTTTPVASHTTAKPSTADPFTPPAPAEPQPHAHASGTISGTRLPRHSMTRRFRADLSPHHLRDFAHASLAVALHQTYTSQIKLATTTTRYVGPLGTEHEHLGAGRSADICAAASAISWQNVQEVEPWF